MLGSHAVSSRQTQLAQQRPVEQTTNWGSHPPATSQGRHQASLLSIYHDNRSIFLLLLFISLRSTDTTHRGRTEWQAQLGRNPIPVLVSPDGWSQAPRPLGHVPLSHPSPSRLSHIDLALPLITSSIRLACFSWSVIPLSVMCNLASLRP